MNRTRTLVVASMTGAALLAWGPVPAHAHFPTSCGVDVTPAFVDPGAEDQDLRLTIWHGTTFDYMQSLIPFGNVLPPLRPWDDGFEAYTHIQLRKTGTGASWVVLNDGETSGWLDSSWLSAQGRQWTIDPAAPWNEGIGLGYWDDLSLNVDIGGGSLPGDLTVEFRGWAFQGESAPDECKALSNGPVPLHEGQGILTICAYGVETSGDGCNP